LFYGGGCGVINKQLTSEVCEVIVLLYFFFKDYEKISLWLRAPNIQLGTFSPIQIINRGEVKKLLSFIKTSYEENGDL
jgi:hypothetical protein